MKKPDNLKANKTERESVLQFHQQAYCKYGIWVGVMYKQFIGLSAESLVNAELATDWEKISSVKSLRGKYVCGKPVSIVFVIELKTKG